MNSKHQFMFSAFKNTTNLTNNSNTPSRSDTVQIRSREQQIFRSIENLIQDGILDFSHLQLNSINYSFNGTTRLTSILLPSTVQSIGNSVFESCSSLYSIRIPDSVTSLGKKCFLNCTSLKEITLPSGLKEIPYACFENIYGMHV